MTKDGRIQSLASFPMLMLNRVSPVGPEKMNKKIKQAVLKTHLHFAIKTYLSHSSLIFPLFALCWWRHLCILTVSWCRVELYTVSYRLTGLFVCRTHTAITWGAAGPQSRIGKFKLTQLHLDEQTGLYRTRHRKSHNCMRCWTNNMQGNGCR